MGKCIHIKGFKLAFGTDQQNMSEENLWENVND